MQLKVKFRNLTHLSGRFSNMSAKNNKIFKEEFLSFPYLTLAVMALITTGATFLFYQNAYKKDQMRFDSEVAKLSENLENNLSSTIMTLKATRGYFETNDRITKKKFKRFVDNFSSENKLGGIESIGFAQKINSKNRNDFVRKMKDEGSPDFKIFPEGERDEFQAVILVEPQNSENLKTIGFDMTSEAIRSEAMNSARESGKATITSKANLSAVDENSTREGVLIYLPVYQISESTQNETETNNSLTGYIFATVKADTLIESLSKSVPKRSVGVSIYDGEFKPENLFATTSSDLIDYKSKWNSSNILDVGGRKWLVRYKALPKFFDKSDIYWTLAIPFGGGLLSILLFAITYAEANARLEFENATLRLKESEKEKSILFESEKKAREEAEKSNRLKDEFLSVISHELRTPLNSIAGWTKILQGKSLTEYTRKRALDTIEKNIRNQSKLVEELLNFSEITSQNVILDKQPVEFTNLLKQSLAEVEPAAQEKNIKLICSNNLNGEKIICEEGIIKRALSNLLRNAVKFTSENGKIEIKTEHDSDTIKLSIRDNGQGIDKEFQPHIFDTFRQADSSTTRKHGGLGLGLAISQQIIKLHKGDIRVISSGKNKGTEFIIELPYILDKS